MATFAIGSTSYNITDIVDRDGKMFVYAVELNHSYPSNLAWRASVTIVISTSAEYRFQSWNMGITLGVKYNDGIDTAVYAHLEALEKKV